jgi:hypothetical protein
MSQNETDQIGRETGRTFRQILNAGHAYIAMLRRNDRYSGVRKLNRGERREMAEHIRVQVGEQRIAEAWFTRRVEDYRRESAVFRHRMANDRGWDESAAGRENARLDAMRYSIESTVHNTALPLEQRGQVVRQLETFDFAHDLDKPVTSRQLFGPMGSRDQMLNRDAAIRSEQWIAARRDESDRILNHHARREDRSPGSDLAAENTALQARVAALRARVAELEGGQRDQGSSSGTQAGQASAPAEAGAAAARPMTWDQQEAVQGLRRAEIEFGRARPGELPNQSALAHRNAAYYNALSRGLTKEQAEWEIANVAANSRSQTTISYQGRDGQVRRVHGYHASEAEAAVWADRKLRTGDWAPDTQVRATSIERGHDRPYWSAGGDLTQVQDQARDWRNDTDPVSGSGTGHAAGQQVSEQDQLRKQHRLSVDHNAELADQNANLTAQLTEVIGDNQKLADRIASLKEQLSASTNSSDSEPKTNGSPRAKSTRSGGRARTSGGTESAAGEPESARAAASSEHADEDEGDLVSKAKATQRAARANGGTGNGARAKSAKTSKRPMNAFATAAAEQDHERDGAER